MTLKQIGTAAAVAAVLVAAYLGIWNMVDRRFAEMRDEMRDIRTEMSDIRTQMQAGFDRVDTRLDALTADVHMLIGRQQERDRAPADD